MSYKQTELKNFKGHFLSKGDKLYIGDFIVGNLGSYLIFQEDGNLVHYDTFASCNLANVLWDVENQFNSANYICWILMDY